MQPKLWISLNIKFLEADTSWQKFDNIEKKACTRGWRVHRRLTERHLSWCYKNWNEEHSQYILEQTQYTILAQSKPIKRLKKQENGWSVIIKYPVLHGKNLHHSDKTHNASNPNRHNIDAWNIILAALSPYDLFATLIFQHMFWYFMLVGN